MDLVCRSSDVNEDECFGAVVKGVSLFLVRKHGELNAYINCCPHVGVPLEWQPNQFLDSSLSLIQCSTHGALFTIEEGNCVSGPCVGDHLQKLRVEECHGEIHVALPD